MAPLWECNHRKTYNTQLNRVLYRIEGDSVNMKVGELGEYVNEGSYMHTTHTDSPNNMTWEWERYIQV